MTQARPCLMMLLMTVICSLVTGQRCSNADERLVIRAMGSPSGLSSAEPRLVAVDGGVAMSWLERRGAGHALRWSRWRNGRWSNPVTIAQGDSFFANWADFPTLRPLGGTRWAAHWLWKSASDTYAYDVRISQSQDDGRTWSRPITPHRDGTPTEHGFVSLLAEEHGVRAVWLDGRKFAGQKDGDHSGADMTVRTAVVHPDGRIADEHELDVRSCECCATAAVRTSKGMLVAYRDRSTGEIRDIALTRYEDGRWTQPYLVNADGWKISGCPVNGPAMDAAGDHVAIAWFTAAADSPRVYAAFSEDAGRRFTRPIRIDGGDPAGRVGIAMMSDGSARVSWLETVSGKAAVKVRQVWKTGRSGESQIVTAISGARASGFPQIVRSGNGIWFAWTEDGTQSRIHVARATGK